MNYTDLEIDNFVKSLRELYNISRGWRNPPHLKAALFKKHGIMTICPVNFPDLRIVLNVDNNNAFLKHMPTKSKYNLSLDVVSMIKNYYFV